MSSGEAAAWLTFPPAPTTLASQLLWCSPPLGLVGRALLTLVASPSLGTARPLVRVVLGLGSDRGSSDAAASPSLTLTLTLPHPNSSLTLTLSPSAALHTQAGLTTSISPMSARP